MNKAIIGCLSALALTSVMPMMAQQYSCEYYWNHDPGVGNATVIAGVATDVHDGQSSLSLTLDAQNAHPGVNVLGMRVFDGRWSPTVVSYVFVPMAPAEIHSAICEYWWDKDPGIGLGSQLTVETDGVGTIDLTLAAESLVPGVHTLGLRSCINGHWSPTAYSAVFVKANAINNIDKAEYFWGNDPGYGNGTPINITEGNVVVIGQLDIDFPRETLESYVLTIRAHSQVGGWSVSYTKEFVPVEPTALTLDNNALSMRSLGATEQLTAEIEPANSWRTDLKWVSSNPNVATVDDHGVVTSVGEGSATISVTLGETQLSAVCDVKVVDETRFPLGDANGSMDVTITDVATTIDYTLGGRPASFIYTAADVTKDSEISIADAVGTVNIVLGIDPSTQRRAPRSSEAAVIGMTQTNEVISVMLDNMMPLSAIQFDLSLPQGMKLRENTYPGTFRLSQRGDISHSVDYRQMADGSYRVVVYSVSSASFVGNSGAILSFCVDPLGDTADGMEIVLRGIRVVEANAAETLLADCSLSVSDVSSLITAVDQPLDVYVIDRVLHIVSPCDMQVQMCTIDGISVMLDLHEGNNKYEMSRPGIYIVAGNKVVVK